MGGHPRGAGQLDPAVGFLGADVGHVVIDCGMLRTRKDRHSRVYCGVLCSR